MRLLWLIGSDQCFISPLHPAPDQSITQLLPAALCPILRKLVASPPSALTDEIRRGLLSEVAGLSKPFCDVLQCFLRANQPEHMTEPWIGLFQFCLKRREDVCAKFASGGGALAFVRQKGSYDPIKFGCALSFTSHAERGRDLRLTEKLDDPSPFAVFDDAPAEAKCTKLYERSSKGNPYLFVNCPFHDHCYGHMIIDGGEA